MKKILLLGLFLAILLPLQAFAYTSVKGYYRSNGTYVAPHVRSSPNGLKSDNYSYTGGDAYNKTYGTRGVEWDTPTFLTDPNYYEGKALYESGSSGSNSSNYVPSTYTSSYSNNYQTVTGGYKIGETVICNSNYYKKGSNCVSAPSNSTAYGGDSFYCSSGYTKSGSSCVRDRKDSATKISSTQTCKAEEVLFKDRCVNYYTYCSMKLGDDYFYSPSLDSCASCPSGYKYNYVTSECQPKARNKK